MHRLKNSVDYVLDKAKTTRPAEVGELLPTYTNTSAASLQQAVDYALNRDKTEQVIFESALGCTTKTAFADMLATKKQWHKMGGVAGYHLVQSFAANEVTPELAHKIGLELAAEILGDKYEVVISTHLNTGHLHNHIVWNSVSLTNGKKYHSNAKSYFTQIRQMSDTLCKENALSVITTEKSQQGSKQYTEWLAEQGGQPTWRSLIRQDIDDAVCAAFTWRQFCVVLEEKGYSLRFGGKYATLRPIGKERPVRFKTLGANYTPDAITQRILYPKHALSTAKKEQVLSTVKYGKLRTHGKPAKKLHGLIALYYSYLYKMGVLKRKPKTKSFALREDIRYLDKRISQMQFLSLHKINSKEQLTAYRMPLETEIETLVKARHKIYRNEAATSQATQLTKQITALRREIKLCKDIEVHSLQMQKNLSATALEATQKKERETEKSKQQNLRLQQKKYEKNRS
ncbi:MAG: relaxase/mobilization nuclease domain-containing protein [Oscillospiraceae bacterium]